MRNDADLSDASLIEATRKGRDAAYAELWRRHCGAALAAARAYPTFDPDDLAQEAFASVYSAIRRGKGPTASFRAYLLTSVRNVAASWHRAHREDADDELDARPDPTTEDAAADAALDRSTSAQAFRSLPSRWQEVLWYTEVEGMKPAEVAPLLGMSTRAATQLAFRARDGLREAWVQAHLRSLSDKPDCRWTVERLGSYARGNSSARDTAKVEAHLNGCVACTMVAAEADEVNRRLAFILLPLVLGVTGAGAYLAHLQTGAGGAVAMGAAGAAGAAGMPTAIVSGGSGSSGSTASAGAASGSPVGATALVATVVTLAVAIAAVGTVVGLRQLQQTPPAASAVGDVAAPPAIEAPQDSAATPGSEQKAALGSAPRGSAPRPTSPGSTAPGAGATPAPTGPASGSAPGSPRPTAPSTPTGTPSGTPQPSHTPQPSSTPRPSGTPHPTGTPNPTGTPAPTPTPTPTPTSTPPAPVTTPVLGSVHVSVTGHGTRIAFRVAATAGSIVRIGLAGSIIQQTQVGPSGAVHVVLQPSVAQLRQGATVSVTSTSAAGASATTTTTLYALIAGLVG